MQRHTRLAALAILLVIIASFTGCGSKAARQDLADQRAGCQAGHAIIDHALTQEQIDSRVALALHTTIDGIENYGFAALGSPDAKDLPPPTLTPKQIIEEPKDYAANSKRRREERRGSGFWLGLAGGVLGLLGVGIKIGKRLPGVVGTVCSFADTVLPGRSSLQNRRLRSAHDCTKRALAHSVQITGDAWRALDQIAPDTADSVRRRAAEAQARLGIRDEIREAIAGALDTDIDAHTSGRTKPHGVDLNGVAAFDPESTDTHRMPASSSHATVPRSEPAASKDHVHG